VRGVLLVCAQALAMNTAARAATMYGADFITAS
jgi:hypothetical protein